jgi:hypothetical protein
MNVIVFPVADDHVAGGGAMSKPKLFRFPLSIALRGGWSAPGLTTGSTWAVYLLPYRGRAIRTKAETWDGGRFAGL